MSHNKTWPAVEHVKRTLYTHCGNAEKGEDDYENSINDRRE